METMGWILAWFIGVILVLRYNLGKTTSTYLIFGLLLTSTIFSPLSWLLLIPTWLIFLPLAAIINLRHLRMTYITEPLFKFLKLNMPHMSQTEQEALDSGTVWFEQELFSGSPDWQKLIQAPKATLSKDEQAFIDGPVATICSMVNTWQIISQNDLPQELWDYLKQERFFALIIPKQYGGHEFSAYAHSQILSIIAAHNLTLASTISVPNSLGPAELLLHYGTIEQKNYYLPRLASGEEIPCFALTGPYAGSDASSLPDIGIVCKEEFNGEEVLGIKLNWDKRYITLAPIATILGLAFKLFDPYRLLSKKEEWGITCALIPTHLPGITIGRRHLPCGTCFQNGPTQGKNVFIPISYIIGGEKMAGCGWKMLIERLSCGRAISLPSVISGGSKAATCASGVYTVLRTQFHTSIEKFEGVKEVLARLGGYTYLAEALRIVTASSIDLGEKPAVASAIAKYHVTEFGRKIINDAMDLHGGKGIMMGPSNYLIEAFQAAPIGITVEGANILTRNMIIFGQGAIRCHPFLLKEMEALKYDDIAAFDLLLIQHAIFACKNQAKAFLYALSKGRFALSPEQSELTPYFKQINRASAAFAFVSDFTMLILGGKLKFKESTSARLGDMLSMMYMSACTIKRYIDLNRPQVDFPLVEWGIQYSLATFWQRMDELLVNFPNKSLGVLLRISVMPLGRCVDFPNDSLNTKIAKILTTDNFTRDRLFNHINNATNSTNHLHMLNKALLLFIKTQELRRRVEHAVKTKEIPPHLTFIEDLEYAFKLKIIYADEREQLLEAEVLRMQIINVDDF